MSERVSDALWPRAARRGRCMSAMSRRSDVEQGNDRFNGTTTDPAVEAVCKLSAVAASGLTECRWPLRDANRENSEDDLTRQRRFTLAVELLALYTGTIDRAPRHPSRLPIA